MPLKNHPLWVVTSYYNPAGYQRRLQNFHAFRRNLNAPLLVIELAHSGAHQLSPDDAEVVVRLSGEDRIWQKERLINIAVDALPAQSEFVAWIDCDIVFGNPDWVRDTQRLLSEEFEVTQLFDSVSHLPPDLDIRSVSPTFCHRINPLLDEVSFAHCHASGTYFTAEKRAKRWNIEADVSEFRLPPISHGIAWAARRAVLSEFGLYDACVIGGGDKALAMALIGHAKTLVENRPMATGHIDHYLEWGRRVTASTNGKIGFVPGKVFHLWHGNFKFRGYAERHQLLSELDFDPRIHLELEANGTWRWSRAASAISQYVGEYFFRRREDG